MPHGSWSLPLNEGNIKYGLNLKKSDLLTKIFVTQKKFHGIFYHPKVAGIHVILSNGKRGKQEKE